MVDAVSSGKRTYAIVEVARSKLTTSELDLCRMPDGHHGHTGQGTRFDRKALMWLLYLNHPTNLELVFHLHQTQRKGFARMVLDPAPEANKDDIHAFLNRSTLQRILDAHELEHRTHRQSHCAEVLHDGGNYKVFIKRDYRPSFVSRGTRNTFGFEREWIILDFEPDLRRVHICSVSPDVPLVLANRIAGAFFGHSVHYQNESMATSAEAISAFLQSLLDVPNKLPLVEMVIQNSGLDGSPQLRLNEPENASLALAVRQFGGAFGNPLEPIEDIESIKVYMFKKRVKMIFERADEDGDAFVVRYADQPLNGNERRTFEQTMEHDYGLSVLSTEKRYAS
ncbi:MAG: hypothetical protein MJE77_16740 [Proteobacteria bacterium]|nr:hypothetical protein [Pseudomonadota bacterium]